MNEKQKEQLRILLKSRKKAEKVLAERRAAQQQKTEQNQRRQSNRELAQRYALELEDLARECGLLALAEEAAAMHGGSLDRQVSYYMDRGMSTACLQDALPEANKGELRASHLVLRVIWQEEKTTLEVEIHISKNGGVTFHNWPLPVFPFIWRRQPRVLPTLFARANRHPRRVSAP